MIRQCFLVFTFQRKTSTKTSRLNGTSPIKRTICSSQGEEEIVHSWGYYLLFRYSNFLPGRSHCDSDCPVIGEKIKTVLANYSALNFLHSTESKAQPPPLRHYCITIPEYFAFLLSDSVTTSHNFSSAVLSELTVSRALLDSPSQWIKQCLLYLKWLPLILQHLFLLVVPVAMPFFMFNLKVISETPLISREWKVAQLMIFKINHWPRAADLNHRGLGNLHSLMLYKSIKAAIKHQQETQKYVTRIQQRPATNSRSCTVVAVN